MIISGESYIRRVQIKFVPSLQNEQNFKIDHYKIYRQKASDDDWKCISTLKCKKDGQLQFFYKDRETIEDGETLSYAVAGVTAKGNEGPFSDPFPLVSIKPPQLRIKKEDLFRKIILEWDPIENVKGYGIFRKTKSEEEDWKRIAQITDLANSSYSYTDEHALEDGKAYQYYLTAFDNEMETGPSPHIEAKTKELTPPPQKLQAESGGVKSVRMQWAPLDGPDIGGYAIYRGPEKEKLVRIGQVKGHTANSYLDKGAKGPLKDGKIYYYVIAGINLFDVAGVLSQVVQAKTKPRPVSVRGLTVRAEEGSIYIEWHKNLESDIKQYDIYRRRNEGDGEFLKTVGADQTTLVDEDLKPEDNYSYQIVAEDADGLRSEPVKSEAVLSKVATFLKVTKDNQCRRIELSWRSLKNVDGYQLYRKSDTEDWQKVGKIRGADKLRHIDKKNLKDGTSYWYYLTTYDQEGETSPSNQVQAKTKNLPPPPENLQAESGLHKLIKLTWTPVNDTDIGGYEIYRKTTSATLERIDKVKGYQANAYVDDGSLFKPLEEGTEYIYGVASINLFGAHGELSKMVTAKTKQRPQKVQDFTAKAGQGEIVVEWALNPEPDIVYYLLYRSRSQNDSNWSRIAKLEATQIQYKDSNLKPEVNYQYRIIAIDKDDLESAPMKSNLILSPIVNNDKDNPNSPNLTPSDQTLEDLL